MPDLSFQITGVEPATDAVTPLLQFKLQITNPRAEETIQAILLNAQIQIQCPQRAYTSAEKQNLVELFGPPEVWGKTLRNRLWAHTTKSVSTFKGRVQTTLAVPCTCDLHLASTRYWQGLEGGEVPLLFLFSGSIFHGAPGAGLQVTPISWNSECVYRMPLDAWRSLMERHYPNVAWLSQARETFDQLCAFKRQRGIVTWEEAIEQLMQTQNASTTHSSRTTKPEEVSV